MLKTANVTSRSIENLKKLRIELNHSEPNGCYIYHLFLNNALYSFNIFRIYVLSGFKNSELNFTNSPNGYFFNKGFAVSFPWCRKWIFKYVLFKWSPGFNFIPFNPLPSAFVLSLVQPSKFSDSHLRSDMQIINDLLQKNCYWKSGIFNAKIWRLPYVTKLSSDNLSIDPLVSP